MSLVKYQEKTSRKIPLFTGVSTAACTKFSIQGYSK